MGGQQFATDGVCIDTRELDGLISFDHERGLLEAEAGIQWPKLIRTYLDAKAGETKQWGIAQKQTGADNYEIKAKRRFCKAPAACEGLCGAHDAGLRLLADSLRASE